MKKSEDACVVLCLFTLASASCSCRVHTFKPGDFVRIALSGKVTMLGAEAGTFDGIVALEDDLAFSVPTWAACQSTLAYSGRLAWLQKNSSRAGVQSP